MGKITSAGPQKLETPTSTHHFSHPHPLKPITTTDSQHQQTLHLSSSSSCSGCNLKTSGTIYSCTTCNFFLHKKCFEMPKKITHPFHKQHAFTLLTEPAYPDGLYSCDACGKAGDGFSYHCKPSGVDLHILCASTPLSVTHISHTHKLDLNFESPYPTKDFCCDICRKPGGNHWLYQCNLCEFDAHLSCAAGGALPPVCPPLQQQSHTTFMGFQSQAPPPQQSGAFFRSAPAPSQPHLQPQGFVPRQFVAAPPPPPPMQQNFVSHHPMMNNAAVGVPVVGGVPTTLPHFGVNNNNRENNDLAIQAIQQMISNNQAMTQAMLAGGGGGVAGGGFGGGSLQVMQMLSGISNSGIGGGGGGGGIPGLNAFGGGGGHLQALISGGGGGDGGIGGGGIDFVQSLLGGGGNGLDFLGGGGLDLLGGALGGFGF